MNLVNQKEQENLLIKQVLEGDLENYRFLVERYHRGLIQHLYNLLLDADMAEDIAQEAFIKAYQKLQQYNPEYAFSTWLYKIADNIAYRHFRQQRPVQDIDQIEEYFDDGAESLAEKQDKHFTVQVVRKAVNNLPLDYRRVISFYYWENCSYEEIANKMGRPVGTVRTWLHRAKQELRKELYGQF